MFAPACEPPTTEEKSRALQLASLHKKNNLQLEQSEQHEQRQPSHATGKQGLRRDCTQVAGIGVQKRSAPKRTKNTTEQNIPNHTKTNVGIRNQFGNAHDDPSTKTTAQKPEHALLAKPFNRNPGSLLQQKPNKTTTSVKKPNLRTCLLRLPCLGARARASCSVAAAAGLRSDFSPLFCGCHSGAALGYSQRLHVRSLRVNLAQLPSIPSL